MNLACSNLWISGSADPDPEPRLGATGDNDALDLFEGGGVGEEEEEEDDDEAVLEDDDLGELATLEGGGGEADPSKAILDTSLGRSCESSPPRSGYLVLSSCWWC